MSIPQITGLNGVKIEIKPFPRQDNLIKLIVSCSLASRELSMNAMSVYFPDTVNISPRSAFVTLMYIFKHQCNVETTIQKRLGFSDITIKLCLSYLLMQGLIFKDTRPRKNKFGAYVYDKVYRSTVKGERLLVSIFDVLGLLDFEALLNEV